MREKIIPMQKNIVKSISDQGLMSTGRNYNGQLGYGDNTNINSKK